MQIIDNSVTKIFSNDKNNSYSILTYLDFKKELTPEFITNYVNNIVDENQILKQDIYKRFNKFYFKTNENFNIDNHIIIKYVEHETFSNKCFTNTVLNMPLVNNAFLIVTCIDKIKQVSRVYFKINHAYTDGYGLINILSKPLSKNVFIPEFKRKTTLLKTIYHYIIGTIVLLIMNIKIFLKLFFNEKPNIQNVKPQKNDNKTDFIRCNPFQLDKIKKAASQNNITINDFLYSLMIKTDKLYTKRNRVIQTCSPINISKLSSTNNMCPLLINANNSLNIQEVHSIFDSFKYSLFIPFLSFVLNNFLHYINIEIQTFLYDSIIYNSDYIYSNIIGPPIKEINENSDVNISDIHFLTTTKMDEIVFNIISCEDKVNIICSFKEGRIKDKKRFEKCIYRAYNSLINEENIGFA